MQITALAGGVGGARFLRGLRDHLDTRADLPEATLTVVGNTGDDITLWGLRVSPDLDTLMYTLGGGIDEAQGWGRVGDGRVVQGELAAYGAQPQWFGLGDLDIATHVARTQWLREGATPSEVVARLAQRWGLPGMGVRLLPMSDEPVETHVIVDTGAPGAGETERIHFQEWWVRHQAALPARAFEAEGIASARPAPGVLEAIAEADVVVLPPSNPVVSIGIILGVPGVREALAQTAAPVVGVSPVVGGAPVRGHADACLSALGLPTTPAAVAGLYADFLDGWLVAPGEGFAPGEGGPVVVERPLLMSDRAAAARLAGDTLDLALDLRPGS